MKNLTANIAILICILIALFSSVMNAVNGYWLMAFLCGGWTILLGCVFPVRTLPAKMFTMIELLAVITITTILLTIAFRVFKVNHAKSDTRRIAGYLKLVHTQSMSYSDPLPVELDLDDYNSTVTAAHSQIYFLKGGVVDADGKVLLGCTYEVKDKEEKPFVITVNSFTGKVSVRIKED